MIFAAYLLIGAFAGVIAGLLGVGGGLIIVPSLVFLFAEQGMAVGVLTHVAIGTSLATIVLTSISSIRTHHLNQGVRWEIFRVLMVGIVVGALLGAVMADSIQGPILQKLIGVFAVLVATQMAFGLKPSASRDVPGSGGLVAAGGLIGSVSAIFGIGGGSLSVPILTYYSVPIRQAVGTSAACGLPIAVAGAIGFIVTGWGEQDLPEGATGYVYWPAFLGIVTTSIICARIGAKLAHRIPAVMLKRVFSAVLFVVGLKFLVY
ncbi:MAG: hypothetical protein COB04_17520 [Gammaproteobacteria bacterium]|nr:MAG: hypothetical protein COB04_17520 [Gammaproteobacteria bacterium]